MKKLVMLALLAGWGCSTAPAGKTGAPVATSGKAPYDAPAVAAAATIRVDIDPKAAREILESLGRPRLESSDLRVIEDLPAVQMAIRDSSRTAEAFERDFAGAFQSESRAAVFDFRSIRENRERWQALLEGVVGRQADLIRMSQLRAASLLPADASLSVKLEVDLSFALAGLEDDLIVRTPQGDRMVIDFARTLSDSEGATLDGHVSRLSRLIGGEVFRQAWNAYRGASPAWKQKDSQLGQLEPLLAIVAAGAPVGLFGVDENFFPLASWLKEPMKRAVDDLNRRADRFVQAQENLDARMELASEIRRPDFGRRVAAPIGGFLADAIAQDSGIQGLRDALRQGPRAFFAAYDRAASNNKDLVPLAKPIKDRLKGN